MKCIEYSSVVFFFPWSNSAPHASDIYPECSIWQPFTPHYGRHFDLKSHPPPPPCRSFSLPDQNGKPK